MVNGTGYGYRKLRFCECYRYAIDLEPFEEWEGEGGRGRLAYDRLHSCVSAWNIFFFLSALCLHDLTTHDLSVVDSCPSGNWWFSPKHSTNAWNVTFLFLTPPIHCQRCEFAMNIMCLVISIIIAYVILFKYIRIFGWCTVSVLMLNFWLNWRRQRWYTDLISSHRSFVRWIALAIQQAFPATILSSWNLAIYFLVRVCCMEWFR